MKSLFRTYKYFIKEKQKENKQIKVHPDVVFQQLRVSQAVQIEKKHTKYLMFGKQQEVRVLVCSYAFISTFFPFSFPFYLTPPGTGRVYTNTDETTYCILILSPNVSALYTANKCKCNGMKLIKQQKHSSELFTVGLVTRPQSPHVQRVVLLLPFSPSLCINLQWEHVYIHRWPAVSR